MSYCMFSMLNKSKLLLLCLICSCSGEFQMENDLERLYSNSVGFFGNCHSFHVSSSN